MSLVARSLRYYWRHHLGYVLSVALACAVLVAGLMVGDSLRAGLALRTAERVGPIDHVLALEGRWFGSDFVTRLESETTGSMAPLFSVDASAKGEEGRAVGTRLLAVDERMWSMAAQAVELAPGEIILNASLAEALGVQEGESVIVRFERPDALPSESALRSDEVLASLRLRVAAVGSEAWPFALDLYSSGERPHNAFISLSALESRLGWRPLNTVLFDCNCSAETLDSAIDRAWQAVDAQIEFVDGPGWIELRSDRVLLAPRLVEAATAIEAKARRIASWFVDEAWGPGGRASYFFVSADTGGAVSLSQGLGPTDIAVSSALADSLGVGVGDEVKLRLPVLGSRRDVIYREAKFEVARLYREGAEAADASLMPAIPGMSDSESCHEWNVGLPIDLNRITPADEAYWKQHKGAPKAVISMEAARELWATSYGTLTAIRFPSDRGVEALSDSLRAALSPRDFGFFTQDVRDRMQRSSAPINDFGQLFLGFNLFIILSALFLMSVFAGFAIDRRRSQQGLMVAVGYTSAAVGRSVLVEFGIVTLVGCLVGVVAAVGLAQGFITGLTGVWSDAVGVLELPMWISGTTLLSGVVASWMVSVTAAWLGTRTAVSSSAWSNLRGGSVPHKMNPGRGRSIRWGAWTAIVLSLAVALFSSAARGPSAAMVYFGCGALVLVGCLLHVWSWLCRPSVGVPVSLAAVGVAGLRIRPKSSLAVVSVLAVGLFMVGGIGGGTLQPRVDPASRHAGTGGFSWLAETRVPVQADLSGAPGLRAHGLDDHMEPGEVVGIGLFAGDDASCMNLGSAQTPRLLGVNASAWMERDSFRFLEPSGGTWQMLLDEAGMDDVIPVVGDAATVYWGLHLGVGDEIRTVDEQGEALRLRIVGVVENWIFQGALVADRDPLVERFPSRRGDSLFLVDSSSEPDALAARLTDRLGDYGVVVERPLAVLEGYRRVERTFMLIFGALGGLGVILAVVGMVALFYRRMVDAERERGLLVALGFPPRHARMLGLAEMGGLMFLGFACGVLASVVAMIPSLQLMDVTAFLRFLCLASSVLLVGLLGAGLVSVFTDGRRSVEAIHRNQ